MAISSAVVHLGIQLHLFTIAPGCLGWVLLDKADIIGIRRRTLRVIWFSSLFSHIHSCHLSDMCWVFLRCRAWCLVLESQWFMVSGSVDLYARRGGWRYEPELSHAGTARSNPGAYHWGQEQMKVIEKFSGVDYMIIPAAMQNGSEGDTNGSRELLQRYHWKTVRMKHGGQMWERINGEDWMWGVWEGRSPGNWEARSRDLPGSSESWWLSQSWDQTRVFSPHCVWDVLTPEWKYRQMRTRLSGARRPGFGILSLYVTVEPMRGQVLWGEMGTWTSTWK